MGVSLGIAEKGIISQPAIALVGLRTVQAHVTSHEAVMGKKAGGIVNSSQSGAHHQSTMSTYC